MCLAIPARIESVSEGAESAIVSLGGVRKEISLALVEDVRAGDYVLVHVGFALQKIGEEEAARTLALMREGGVLEEALAEMAGEEAAVAEAGEGRS